MRKRKKKVPEECTGCQSFDSYCEYYYMGSKNKHRFFKQFRRNFCPCSKCLVKTMCNDPKVTIFFNPANKSPDKCKILRKAMYDFAHHVKQANATTTSIRRRNRKLKLKKKKEGNEYAQPM